MHIGQYILDANGKPVPEPDTLKWAKWLETAQRRVASDFIFGVHVSTVFLGVDYTSLFGGPPMLWETMIFGGRHDQYQERYASREDALAGHARAVATVRGVNNN